MRIKDYLLLAIICSGVGWQWAIGAEDGQRGAQSHDALPSLSEQQNKALVGLLENAAQQLNRGQLEEAAATLERALRIEPRNPVTWHYLGQTALYQGRYQQVEALAAKSNSLAGGDVEFRARNDWLIGAARHAANKNLAPMLGQQEKRHLEMQLEQEAKRRRQAEAESDQLRERLERTDSIQLASPNDRPMTEPGPLSRATFEPRLADTDKSDTSTPMTRKVNTLESAPKQADASRNGDYESRKESRKEQMKEERERLKEQRSQEKELQKNQREREREARKQQREEEKEDKKHREEMAREQKKHDEEMRKLDGEKHKREKE